MKKKIILIFCGFLFVLGGCSDATTSVSKSDTVMIQVGDEKITKGDFYTGLVAAGNSLPVEKKMNEILIDKEVPITDEIKEKAKETLASYKENYEGDKWVEAYTGMGYESEEEFFDEVLVYNERVTLLTQAYVKENFDELAKRFKPRMAQVIEISDPQKAEEAFVDAKKKDADFTLLAQTYGDTTKFDGSEVVYTTHSDLSDVLWNNIAGAKKSGKVIDKVLQDTTSGTYYIVKVTNHSPKKFKDEAIDAIKAITIDTTTPDAQGNMELSLADQAFHFYLQKYDYSIHDINVYETLLSTSKKFER